MIVIEDLKVSNMSKSAAGTVSQPGRNVRAKSGLNRSILDQGWYEMCGYTANADVNGARNILAAGHAVLACGEMVQSGRSLKQEPTEMIQATA
ncbi:hypothetical protein DIV18_02340 [Escherichia coli]|nr:hypothetical protein DIV18_02340 [Escherichia coli]